MSVLYRDGMNYIDLVGGITLAPESVPEVKENKDEQSIGDKAVLERKVPSCACKPLGKPRW